MAGGTGSDGAACSTTDRYREETWVVPKLVLQSRTFTKDGVPVAAGKEVVNQRHLAWYHRLEAKTHYLNRPEGDTYEGVLFEGDNAREGFGDDMVVTRNGRAFNVEPR